MFHRFSLTVFLASLLAVCHVALAQVPSAPGDWPQWRGPNRDGISLEENLLKEWPEEGPPLVWQVDTAGVGYASLAIKEGRIFTQGDLDGVEHIIALSAEDGRLLWAVQPEPVASRLDERVAEEIKRTDTNGDGVVDEAEALVRLGWNFNNFDKPLAGDPQEIAAKRAARLIARLDKDSDGRLSFAEAGSLLREHFERIDAADPQADVTTLARERAAALIREFDEDGDGRISRQEVRGSALERVFNRVDQKDADTEQGDEQLTLEEIRAYLADSEAGKDGYLTQQELQTYYAQHHPGGDGILSAAELRSYHGGYRNGMGDGPRGTPTVDGDRVYAEGGNGDLTCLEAATGKTLWHVNLSSDLGGGRPGWGYSESPLIDGDLVIVTPGGGSGTMAALNKQTGELVWRSEELTEAAHYASPVLADIGGVRQVVQFARNSLFGVTVDSGKLLWQYSAANNGTANCCTPILSENYVLASSAYGTGGGLARITGSGDQQSAEEVYFEKKLACHHGGMVQVGEHLYSNAGGTLLCMHLQSGEIVWQARSVGKGSLVVADGMLYLLGEGHQVALAEATPEEYRERGRFKIPSHGRPSWAHPVVAGGRLYVRDQQSLTVYDVRAQ